MMRWISCINIDSDINSISKKKTFKMENPRKRKYKIYLYYFHSE